MKTNFTMTKRLLFAFTALAFVASSCSEDPVEVPAPAVAGVYSFTSATLIDGDISDATSTDLVIEHGGGPGIPAVIPAGETPTTSFFVNEVLKGVAPCVDETTPITYKIDLQENGDIIFICTSENDAVADSGTWKLTNENKTLVLTIESNALGQVIVEIEDLVVAAPILSGTINSYPMVKTVAEPIGPTNLQFMAFDVILTK